MERKDDTNRLASENWLSTNDVATRLGMSRYSVLRWVKRGWLHPTRLPNRWFLFDPEEIATILRTGVIHER